MALSVQFLHREEFESRTLRALGGAACMGVLGAIAQRLHFPLEPGYFAVVAAAMAGARASPGNAVGLRAALAVLPALPFFLGAPDPLPQSLAGGVAAALVAWLGNGRAEAGRPGSVAASAAAAGVLVPLALYTQQVMEARFLGSTGLLPVLTGFLTLALFWSIGTLPANVVVEADAVEARGRLLEDSLKGEARPLAVRALGLYRQCKEVVLRMPASAGRTELLGVLEKMAQESFSLAEAHAGLEAQLGSVVANDVDAQVRELRARAASTQDAVARRQLELAASSLGEELNHLDALSRRRERLLAQLHAQVALLERARVSFIGVQGSEMGAKGAQAAQLARKLKSLGEEPSAPASDDAQPVSPPHGTRVTS
ncbi:hypothetical protein HPC49_31410 [Pyxidicoccus fallax]|uniref:DUF1090 domain-containing protein n=1 Tax=Pyxidicoccus fallax TaxID=394095 RepID=A0A848LQM7_9BACT|nr:hypothetical protein [Pyxidicoccus fallax]NMO20208.1 DUF1090 domain-containing protein [Pyxidicoccus fallax]NPC82717.1 hypothetical protein [Pyxidicoccus fallax]